MALKSVLQIELRDAAFQRFQDQVKSLPKAWVEIGKKIEGNKASFDRLVAAAVADNVQAKLRLKVEERAVQLSKTAADRWRDMARSTKTVAGNIKDATESLLKWSGVVGIVSGLLGAGGIWGIDRLAQDVSGSRRSSLGLGVSIGQNKAFNNAFGRLFASGDASQFLSGVAGAKFDLQQRVGLIGAGLSNREINGDTTTAGVALLRHLYNIADTTNPEFYGQVIQARRLGQFVNPEDLERMRNTPAAEREKLFAAYAQNKGSLNVPDATAQKWQDFLTTLDLAKNKIETVFITGLTPLIPGLTKLSDGVSDVIKAFLSAPSLKTWIADVDNGLEKFAKEVGTPDFAKRAQAFADGFAKIADAITKVAGMLTSPGGAAGLGAVGGALIGARFGPLGALAGGLLGAAGASVAYASINPDSASGYSRHPVYANGGGGAYVPKGGAIANAAALRNQDAIVHGLQNRGFSAAQADAIAGNFYGESSYDPTATNSIGAFGLEQLVGERKRAFFAWCAATGRDPNSIDTQLDWVKMERTGESRKWGKVDERATYAAALGSGDVATMTAQFGARVERPSAYDLENSMAKRQAGAASASKSNYVTKPKNGADGHTPVLVTIDNKAGSDVNASVNGMKN